MGSMVAKAVGGQIRRPQIGLAPMGIGGAEIEKKWRIPFARDQLTTGVGHRHGVPCLGGDRLVEWEGTGRADMQLAAASGAVSSLGQQLGKAYLAGEALEVVVCVLQPVLADRMRVFAGQNRRSAGAATGGDGKGLGPSHAIGCQGIKMRRLQHRSTVATGVQSLVIRHHQYNVGPTLGDCRRGDRQKKQTEDGLSGGYLQHEQAVPDYRKGHGEHGGGECRSISHRSFPGRRIVGPLLQGKLPWINLGAVAIAQRPHPRR